MEQLSLIFPEDWYPLSENDWELCEQFVNASNSVGMYIKKRKANLGKVYSQIRNGKLGEFAARQFLITKLGYPGDVFPDLTIYKVKQKSWDADLLYSKSKIIKLPDCNVKTCDLDSASKYSESYVFQATDKVFQNPGDSTAAFVLVDPVQKVFCMRALISITLLIEKKLFKPMKLAKHVEKCAVYYEDLKSLLGENI
jgi:hypothetical protein